MSHFYLTSDLHLMHKNLCEGLRKESPEDNTKKIIENWNSIITKKDKVVIVGDIVMGDPRVIDLLKQLNGKITVVGGNHDTEKCCKALNDIGITVVGCLAYKGYIITHIPIHPAEVVRFKGNIHGHIHLSGEIEGLGMYEGIELGPEYFNVNTEFHNYTPIKFTEVSERLDRQVELASRDNNYEE